MRLAILALGSRGDVQPLVALAVALKSAGHFVRIVAAADYESLARDYDIAFSPVAGYIREIMDFDLALDALDVSIHALPIGFARRFVAQVEPLLRRIITDCWLASQDADALIVSTLGMYAGDFIAEKLGLPVIPAHFHPLGATRYAPNVSFPTLPPGTPLRGRYNQLTHTLAAHGLWQLLRRPLNRSRQDVLGLAPLSPLALWRRVKTPPLTLYGYSPHIAPPPPDWDARHRVTGFWFLDRPPTWRPPIELVKFLSSGPPPVYIGFGSILVGRNPNAVTQLLVEALAQAGQRGILFSGWGDVGNISLPDRVLKVDSIPHDWLFPQMAAVVAHGGAGTTAATLRAGAPSIVIPVFGDQIFWVVSL